MNTIRLAFLLALAVSAFVLVTGARACGPSANVNQAEADQICGAMSLYYGESNGWRTVRWECKPFHPTHTCVPQARVWVMLAKGRARQVWYLIVLAQDGTIMDSVQVPRMGDPGGLLA